MRTPKSTMIGVIAELIETLMEKCRATYPADAIPHVLGEETGSSADIDWLANDGDKLHVRLTDGASFTLQVTGG